MKKQYVIMILALGLGLVRCAPAGSSSSSATPVAAVTLSANLTNAVSAARVQTGFTSASSSSTGVVTESTTVAANDLVGVDASGNLQKVFSTSIPVYTTLTTTNYVVVDGQFASTTAKPLKYGDGSPVSCLLLAFPKTTSGNASDIVCLTKGLSITQVGDYSPSFAPSNAHYAHYGVAARGTSVYFTDFTNGVLYKWTEGQSAATAIFTFNPKVASVGLDDVFLDPTSGSTNICVMYAAIGTYTGAIYCGTDSGLNLVTVDATVLAETRMLGKWLVTTDQKIDMTNGSQAMTVAPVAVTRTANGSNGGLPMGASDTVSDGNGGIISRSYASSITHMDSSGNTTVLASTTTNPNQYFQQVFTVGNTTWTWSVPAITGCGQSACGLWDYALALLSPGSMPTSGHTLNQVTSTGLVATNFLTNVGMTYITDLSLSKDSSSNTILKISGYNGSTAVTATIDGSANITKNTTSSVPLDQVVTLH